MSIIHIVDRQTDRVIDDITDIHVIDNFHEREMQDYIESFEFVAKGDEDYAEHLGKRNKLIIPDEEGNGYREFVMGEDVKIHDEEYNEIEVLSDASYLELRRAKIIEAGRYSELTPSMSMSMCLSNTAWQTGVIETSGYRTFDFEEDTNPFTFLKRIAKEFDVELNFRVEIIGNRIVGRYVDLLERIGVWQGVEVEFGHNLNGIRRLENTDDVVTALKGVGPENEEGERIEVIVKDNEALERWGNPNRDGEIQHLIETYEIDSSDGEMSAVDVEKYTRQELEKRINALVEYVANIHDLEHVPELQGYKIRFGDTIRIKDTKFNPPLFLEARIHSQRRNIFDRSKKQVILGDYIEFTEEEVTSIWQELQKEIQRKVDLYQMLDYTYDKETIDWKDEIILGDGKEYSRNVAGEAEANAKEYAEQEAERAEQRALEKAVAKQLFEDTIDDIMGDLVGKADKSVVDDLEDILSTKVDAEWVDGKLVDKANVDDVYVIADIDDMFDNVVSITEYETDINGVISDLESHETRISQTEEDISVKVDRTTFESLEDEVGNIGSEINNAWVEIEANADEIALKASQSSVNSLTNEITDIETELSIQAGKIASKVEQSDFDSTTNTLGNKITTVEQDVEGITQEVSRVSADIDSIEIYKIIAKGHNSGKSGSAGMWDKHGNALNSRGGNGSRSWNLSIYDRNTGEWDSHKKYDLYDNSIGDSEREELTSALEGLGDDKIIVLVGEHAPTRRRLEGDLPNQIYRCGGSKDVLVEANWSTNHPVYILIGIPGMGEGKGRELFADGNIKYLETTFTIYNGDIELSNTHENPISELGGELSSHKTLIDQNADEIVLRATKSEVNTLTGRMNSAETSISNNADEIELRATKTDVNSLTGRVSTAESSISSNATEIGLRVKENEVISAINLTSETALIQAKNINFVGAVSVLSNITGDLGSITAGDITGVNITGATILQEAPAGSILLDDSGLHQIDGNGVKRVSIESENTSFQGFSAAYITLNPNGLPFYMMEGGHGTGDAFIGYLDRATDYYLNITVDGGHINLDSDVVGVPSIVRQRAFNDYLRLENSEGYSALASQYDKVHLQSPVGVHINDWLSGVRYSDLYTGVIRAQTRYVLDTTAYSGTTFMHIKKNTMMGVYEEDGTYIIDFRGNIGSANNKSIRLNNLQSYTVSNSANLYISSAMNVIRSTSARKYKEDVEPIEEWRAEQFFELAKPVWFRGIGEGDIENYSHYGYVADDVAKFEPRLVEFNKDNEPEGFAYDRVPAMLHVVMKKEQARLDDITKISDEHTDDIELLKIENRLLKKRVEKLEKGA